MNIVISLWIWFWYYVKFLWLFKEEIYVKSWENEFLDDGSFKLFYCESEVYNLKVNFLFFVFILMVFVVMYSLGEFFNIVYCE